MFCSWFYIFRIALSQNKLFQYSISASWVWTPGTVNLFSDERKSEKEIKWQLLQTLFIWQNIIKYRYMFMPFWIHLRLNDSSFPHTLSKRMYFKRETRRSTIKTQILKLLLVLLNINFWRQSFIMLLRHNVTILRHSACRFRASFL